MYGQPAVNFEALEATRPAAIERTVGVVGMGPEASTSDLTQDCADAMVRKPGNIRSGMVYPGDRRKQSMGTQARIEPTPDECRSVVTLKPPKVIFRIQNPNDHKKWATSKPQILEDNDGTPIGDNGGKGTAHLVGFGGRKGLDYKCSKKGSTGVQVEYVIEADSPVDGHTIEQELYFSGVKIVPVPRFAPVQGGGVRKAC